MLHAGQSSFFLQLVNTPFFIIVLLSSPSEETPYNLGSFSKIISWFIILFISVFPINSKNFSFSLSNIVLCNNILVSLPVNFLLFRLNIPLEKKN